MKERVTVYDQFLAICGSPLRRRDAVLLPRPRRRARELGRARSTGRAKEDLILQRKVEVGGTTRQYFEVWSVLGKTDEPASAFGHEVAIVSGGEPRDERGVHMSGRDVEVTTEPAAGWDAASYREPTNTDVEPLLLPWGAVKSQVFRFDGAKFAKVKEVAQQPTPGAAGVTGAASPLRDAQEHARRAQRAGAGDPRRDQRQRPLERRLRFALYRQDHGVSCGQSRRIDLQVNVANDARPERVVLIGRDIVVLGPGFKNGTGYAMLTLAQFASDDDVKDLSVRDLTGDGAADLVVRGVRRVSAAGSHDPVETESIFVYELDGETITRIFAIETGREQKKKRIQGLVQFVPSDDHKSFEIDVRPGIARGWTKKTYPWAQEQPGGQIGSRSCCRGEGSHSLRYAWDGAKFAPEAVATRGERGTLPRTDLGSLPSRARRVGPAWRALCPLDGARSNFTSIRGCEPSSVTV